MVIAGCCMYLTIIMGFVGIHSFKNMTLWLLDKSREDLKTVPLIVGRGRLDIRPNDFNEFYRYRNDLFHYFLNENILWLGNDGRLNYGENCCRLYSIRNRCKDGKIDFYIVELWDKLKDFGDVFFYHTLSELSALNKGLKQPEAHYDAESKTMDYIDSFLTSEDQQNLERLIKRLGFAST